MKVGLFIPCYVEQFYPKVAIATLELLEKAGVEVAYPLKQTCCGQPMANSGYEEFGQGASDLFRENFAGYDYVVCPSGSCTLHAKEHILSGQNGEPKIYELCEFLTDVLQIKELNSRFPYKVGLHASCHGLRGLGLARPSELMVPDFNKPLQLLEMVQDIDLVHLARKDECCGFGGTFAVFEEAISVQMGKDRIQDHQEQGVAVITGADMSCLMHLEGLLRRDKSPIKVMHIAEILNGQEPELKNQ
ncbi:L-lactate dehydrogenase complex protein LldE [Cyclobacterium xiamenense]|uniref:L-lactate dehydrogenase complex protein LldE n=1 Tax=Cyclobacterium xiamenense TaxID=1297121 RepID=A0A1H6VG51_9BACT|nr:(Fe-S)-binding protein [Cyclobacterium xiamenense]SEJ03558.1 L-lactate dehydrogenase complex protein LldE [Cyclobacterium xiamenense]